MYSERELFEKLDEIVCSIPIGERFYYHLENVENFISHLNSIENIRTRTRTAKDLNDYLDYVKE